MLNQLEHRLLSGLCDDREPLHALYSDVLREMPGGATLEDVITALLTLIRLGYAKAYFFDEDIRRYVPRPDLDAAALWKHCVRRSAAALQRWPAARLGGEYFFDITPAGREEEVREIYAPYYPDPVAAGQN